jgi:hypothetical protein
MFETEFDAGVTSKVIEKIYDDNDVADDYNNDDEVPEVGMKSETFDESGNYKFCPNCHMKLSITEKSNRKCYSCDEKF